MVHREATRGVFDLQRTTVPGELQAFVDHIWTVTWDLGETSIESAVIPFPSVNLAVEWGDRGAVRHGHALPAVLVHGVVTRLFRIELSGSGGVVGVRFRPGGFAALFNCDVSTLTDRVLPADDVIDPALVAELAGLVAMDDPEARVGTVVDVLVRSLRAPSERFLRVARLVDEMRDDPDLVRVDQLPERCGWTVRTIQRMFHSDVGAGPKWVLGRFRLQEAALALEQQGAGDLAGLAASLGWYDQAHFTNEFRSIMGVTPGEYATAVRPE